MMSENDGETTASSMRVGGGMRLGSQRANGKL